MLGRGDGAPGEPVLLHRFVLAVAVLAAVFIASQAQEAAPALVAALRGEINFVSATTRDGARTTDVELVIALCRVWYTVRRPP